MRVALLAASEDHCYSSLYRKKRTVTPYRGIGKDRISSYGQVECTILYNDRIIEHVLFVLPDDEAVVPVLIGRDVWVKFKIRLCQKK